MARDHFLGAAWITVLISLAFLPTVLAGVPVASGEHLRKIDRILAAAPVPAAQPISLLEEASAFFRHPMMQASVYDPAFYWIDLPNDVLQADAFRHGELPLWNPYSGLGTPLLATGQTAAFFPLKLIVYLTSVASGYSAFLIARLWVAGFATYGFARSAGVQHTGALLAATGYALSGFVVTHFHNVESSPATMLPLAFWAVERVIRAPRIGTGVALGIALGNVNLSGHPESALFGGIAAGAFAITRVMQVSTASGSTGWRSRVLSAWRPVFALGVGAIVGAAITAIVAVPLLERMALGAGSLLSRPPATTWADAGRNVALPVALHMVSALASPQQQYNTYVGPLAIVLTVVAIRHVSASYLVRAISATAIASASMLLISRESEVFTILPIGLNAFYGVAPLSFCLATLAGVGLDWLVLRQSFTERVRPLVLPLLFIAVIFIAIRELAHDDLHSPSVARTSIPLVIFTILWISRAHRIMHRAAHRAKDTSAHVLKIEAIIVATGTGIAFFTMTLWVMSIVYQTWLGQSASGTAVLASLPESVPWTAKGRTSSGVWRLNIDHVDAEVFFPPSSDAPALKWWDTDTLVPITDYQFDDKTGAISFAIPGQRFTGVIRGAFHRIVNPETAWWILAEFAVCTAGTLAVAFWRRGRHLGLGAVLITGASLISITSARNPPVNRYDFAPSPAIAWLQREAPGERVASLSRDTLTPNVNAIFGIRSTDLQDPIQDCRYQALMRSLSVPATPRKCNGQNQTNLTAPDSHAMRVLGATIALQSRSDADALRRTDANPNPLGFALAYEDADVTIYRLNGHAPRVRVTTAIVPEPNSAHTSLETVIAPMFDPDTSVVVELSTRPTSLIGTRQITSECSRENPLVLASIATSPAQLIDGTDATITAEGWNWLDIAVSTPAPAFLSLAESYFPEWTATADGVPIPVCRGNYAMMAIPIPQGRSKVHFRYGVA